MKVLSFALSLLMLSTVTNLFANDPKFEEGKAAVVNDLQARLTALTDHKNCVQAATDPKAFQACGEKWKNWNINHQAEMEKVRAKAAAAATKDKAKHK